MRVLSTLLLLALQQTSAFDYGLSEGEDLRLSLLDVDTGISDIKTIFNGELVGVTVVGIEFAPNEGNVTTPDFITWETKVDGKVQASGTYSLVDVGRELPSEIEVGEISVGSRGRHEIVVLLSLGDSSLEPSGEYESYAAGVSIIPLIVVLVLAASTRMVSSYENY